MGFNLYSCCHKCGVQIMHSRGRENRTILDFYIKHLSCLNNNQRIVETIIDQVDDMPDWIYNYKDDELQKTAWDVIEVSD